MNKKKMLIFSLCVMVFVISIAYAAFQQSFSINGTTQQLGNFSVKITGCVCVTGNATCTPAGTTKSNTASMTADLKLSGNVASCSFNVINDGNLKIKPNATSPNCTIKGGITDAESSTSLDKPMYYTVSWKKSKLAAGATGDTELTIGVTYSSSITQQPTTTSAEITCTLPYTQDI